MSLFDFPEDTSVGVVNAVDTGTVVVAVHDDERIRTIQVNQLVVVRSSRPGHHFVGIVTKIMRKPLLTEKLLSDDDEATQAAGAAESILRVTLVGTHLDRLEERSNVFRRTLESVPEIDALCFALDGKALTSFMRAISANVPEGTPTLSLGSYTLDDEAEALLDGNRFFQRHGVIVGGTGSGKSWTVARVLEQVSDLPMANAILFDIHGEYQPLEGPGVSHFRIAGPGDLESGEGLAQGVLYLPYWLLTYEEMLALILDRSDQNAPNQAMLLAKHVVAAKESALDEQGLRDKLPSFTIDSPIPYNIGAVLTDLAGLDAEMVPGASTREKQGPYHGKLTRFIQRLENKLGDKRMGFLFAAPAETSTYEWMTELCEALMKGTNASESGGGVKVLNFSEVPSDVLPLMVGLVARLVFYVQQWIAAEDRHPIALFCDEAHLYIPQRADAGAAEQSLENFERVAKEGRKYGVGLVVISQRPSEVNRTVLSQCGNYVAMRLANRDDRSVVQGLLPESLGGIAESLPILDIGEALVVGDASLLPSRVRVTPPNQKPRSATVEFWDCWAADEPRDGVATGVEALRRQAKIRD